MSGKELKKKKIAALSGVLYYLHSEQEQQSTGLKPRFEYPSPWALQGRQTIMHMRNLMQRRVLKR